MSFASEVKKELLSIEDTSTCCKKAMIFGILQNNSDIVFSKEGIKLVVKSHILTVIQYLKSYLTKYYDIDTMVKYGDDNNINSLRYYYLEISKNTKDIIDDFYLSPIVDIDHRIDIIKNTCCKNAFIRGMFVSKGSINDPRKNCYHLEITCKNYEQAMLIKYIFDNNTIESKIRERKNLQVVYIKKSEDISNALALMGASSGVFYFEDSRIFRDVNNMANRMANCDIANVKKSTDAAIKQLKAIAYIREHNKFNNMPVRVQTMAIMREDYPEATLADLSEFSDNYFGKPLSKSGINHCLKSLMQCYDSLLTKKEYHFKTTENKEN